MGQSNIIIGLNTLNKCLYFRHACSIQFNEKVIVTGGYYTGTTFYTTRIVSVYNIGGWVEDLPDLNTGRRNHGCGHYVDNNNDIVRLVLFILLLIFISRPIW